MDFYLLDSVYYVVENYGWYLLIGAIIFWYVYSKYLSSHLEKYKAYRFEQEYAAKYHKNPDLFASHVTGQQRFVEKLQENYNKEAEQYVKKMKEKEEKKKQEFLDKYGKAGYVLGDGNENTGNESKQNSLRPDYNPLMGGGSSSNYRAARRSPCGGGGCGR